MRIRLTAKWWYWLAALLPLCAGVAGWPLGVPLALAVTAGQVVHFVVKTGRLNAFSVQTPVAFCVLLALGSWTPLAFLHWLQIVGTTVRLLFDYCLLARSLSLAPWNRTEPLSWNLVKRVYLTPPVDGSILTYMHASAPVERPRAAQNLSKSGSVNVFR